MTIADELNFNPRAQLEETCPTCNGVVSFNAPPCISCNGIGRVRRGTHDARSAVDYEPAPDTAPRFVARVVALAQRHPNDADLGSAVRALAEVARD